MDWISVKDSLPKDEEDVLTWDGCYQDVASIFYWEEGHPVWMRPPSPPIEVTHWMPLPDSPKCEVKIALEKCDTTCY